MYAIIGLVYGFIQNFIQIPICYYVFGPLSYDADHYPGTNTTVPNPGRSNLQQCGIVQAITTMPWNLKVFYGLFLDQFGFFGTRRKGWIIFGWTGGLILLGVTGFLADGLANQDPKDAMGYPTQPSNFFGYTMLLLVMCAFYIFSDVAGDGMTIELSKFEPPESRGFILTTGQMVRFGSTIGANILGIFFMNGKTYVPPENIDKAFPFEFSFSWIHMVLVICCLPFYVGMIFWLKDPPKDENQVHHSTMQILATLWELMKTKVMFLLIVGMLLNMAVASLINPAQNVMQQIVKPSSLNNGVGSMFGNVIFLVGVWFFRTYLMDRNWRYTFVATGVILALNGVFMLIMIYNAWGIGQNPWFFVFGNNVLNIIQGVSQVLSSLAVVEVAPKGFEASVYEFLTTMHNAGITLNLNLMNILQPIFDVASIADKYDYGHGDDNHKMMVVTVFTMCVNVVGVFLVAYMIPKDKAQCKEWLEAPGCWKTVWMGLLGSLIGWGCLIFSLVESIKQILPSDDAGGGNNTTTAISVINDNTTAIPVIATVVSNSIGAWFL